MIPVNDSKTFCLYCRGEIINKKMSKNIPSLLQQYHQDCFDEMVKDNHCDYCSNILNELNIQFTEHEVKIHQQCKNDVEHVITEKATKILQNYLKDFPLKKLAKEYAFYEMKGNKFTVFLVEFQNTIVSQLPDFSSKSSTFQLFIDTLIEEIVNKLIAQFVKIELQAKLDDTFKKCRSNTKKEFLSHLLNFIWIYYLEIPISYKNKLNHKILPKPTLDTVNYTLFHFILEKLFKTSLDFNSIVNNNYNDILDYLLSQPIAIHQLTL